MVDLGNCSHCGSRFEPVMFEETEYRTQHGAMIETGRVRRNASHLICTGCLKNAPIDDDTLAGEWRNKLTR